MSKITWPCLLIYVVAMCGCVDPEAQLAPDITQASRVDDHDHDHDHDHDGDGDHQGHDKDHGHAKGNDHDHR